MPLLPLRSCCVALALAGLALDASAQAPRTAAEAAESEGRPAAAAERPAAPAVRGGLQPCVDDVLLVADSGLDGVAVHDPATGDLVNGAFIVDPTNLSTPKDAIGNFDGDGIFVVDQIDDAVQEYDCNGAYVGLFAPAGGVNTAVLDNAIAMDYSPDGTELWVTVTGGANQDAVARFDQGGNYLGNIVANSAGGVDGPFDVLVRDADMLVPAINTDDVHQYDLSGNFLGVFQDPSSGINFPEQANLAANGNVLVAGFSTPSGAYEYDGATGAQVGYYGVVGGLRGIYELPNGNLLVTNSTGISEITRSNTLVRLIGDADQYVELFEAPSTCDLSLSGVSATPDPVAAGGTLNVTATAANAGAPQPVALVMVYSGPASGTLTLVSGTIPTTPGVTRTIPVRVPGAAPAGTYTLVFELRDGAGAVCGSETVTVTVSAARVGSGPVAFEAPDAGVSFAAEASAAAGAVSVSPNPSAGQATLRFTLAEAQAVRLAVYDVLGREVAVLVDGAVEAGAHAETFDARGLPAGVYVYRLTVGGAAETGRMTLTR